MVGDEIINSRRHAAGREIIAAGVVEMNEIAPAIRPDSPAIGWSWLQGRWWRFSFDAFTFSNFFTSRSWWWSRCDRRDKASHALLNLEHSVSEVKSLHVGSGKADLIERRQLLNCRINNRDHLR